MKPLFREKFKKWMKKKISFRFHMSLIMLSTIFLGMVSNFVLMNTIGISHPAWRYPLTVLLSYGWFLFFIRLYVRNILLKSSSGSVLDFVDVIPNMNSQGSSTSSIQWSGDGGTFSGGGASGDWGCGDVVTEVAKEATKEAVGSSVAGLVDDEGGALVVLVIGGILAALVFGSGAYFIWHSPEILSECLLQVILVSGMRKRMKKFSETEWASHIFKTTVWPFVMVLVVSFGLGVTLRGVCPEANNLKDYKLNCWKGNDFSS